MFLTIRTRNNLHVLVANGRSCIWTAVEYSDVLVSKRRQHFPQSVAVDVAQRFILWLELNSVENELRAHHTKLVEN